MKSPVAILFPLVVAAAVVVTAQYTNQSAPFKLVVLSANHTVNGSALIACHAGAALEGLCLFPPPSPGFSATPFQFNTSATPVTFNATIGQPGCLTFELSGENFKVSEPMSLSYNPVSNVAVPLFTPSDCEEAFVAFDCEGRLNVQGFLDDRTRPETVEVQAYYRWYVCVTFVESYTYTALTWVMGDYPPENPSCVKVDVVRVFLA